MLYREMIDLILSKELFTIVMKMTRNLTEINLNMTLMIGNLSKMIRNDNVKFPKETPISPLGKQLIKDFLNKDPAKRIELIDFAT